MINHKNLMRNPISKKVLDIDELRHKFNCNGNLLGLQVDITYFDLVGVNGVLGE